MQTKVKKESSIERKTMLVVISLGRYSTSRADKQLRDKVAQENRADKKMVSLTKRILEEEALSEISKIDRKIDVVKRRYTLPWLQDGTAILPSELYFEFKAAMSALAQEREMAVKEAASRLPYWITRAQSLGGDLVANFKYPTEEEFISKFYFRCYPIPFPTASDFRCSLSAEDMDEVRKDNERLTNEAVNKAVMTLLARFSPLVKNMAEQLGKYKLEDGKVTGRLYETLVTHIKDIVDVVPSLNLTQNPLVTEIVNEIQEQLCKYDIETLKENAEIRRQVASQADIIGKKLDDYL